jgi:DNA-binding MarR family transcriptional regulator
MTSKVPPPISSGDSGERAVRPADDDTAVVNLWMRLLASTTQIENEVRQRLQQRFGISLARFDYLSQLSRVNAAMRMVDLSRLMRVVGGNLTQITDELEREGWVTRDNSAENHLFWSVRLTRAGRAGFEEIAAEHERWIRELFLGFDSDAVRELYAKLGELRAHLPATDNAARETKP